MWIDYCYKHMVNLVLHVKSLSFGIFPMENVLIKECRKVTYRKKLAEGMGLEEKKVETTKQRY